MPTPTLYRGLSRILTPMRSVIWGVAGILLLGVVVWPLLPFSLQPLLAIPWVAAFGLFAIQSLLGLFLLTAWFPVEEFPWKPPRDLSETTVMRVRRILTADVWVRSAGLDVWFGSALGLLAYWFTL